jgi:hypothetical protein
MLNLFSYRATKPKNMKLCENLIGEFNSDFILNIIKKSKLITCCWRTNRPYQNRDSEVVELLEDRKNYCLGITKNGVPKHPLYLKSDKKIEIFSNPKNN